MKIKKYIAIALSIPFLILSSSLLYSANSHAGSINDFNNIINTGAKITDEIGKVLTSDEGQKFLKNGFDADKCIKNQINNVNPCSPAESLKIFKNMTMFTLNTINSYSNNKDPEFISKADNLFERISKFADTVEQKNYQGRGTEIANKCREAVNTKNPFLGINCLQDASTTSGSVITDVANLLQDLVDIFGVTTNNVSNTDEKDTSSNIKPRMSFYKSTDKERGPLKVQSGGDTFTVNIYADIPEYQDLATIKSSLRYDARYLEIVNTNKGIIDIQDSAFGNETPTVSPISRGQNSEIQVFEANKNTIKSGIDKKLYSVKFRAKKGIKKNTNTELKFNEITIVSRDLSKDIDHESIKITIIGDKNKTICGKGLYGTPPNCHKLKVNKKNSESQQKDKNNNKNSNVSSKSIIYNPPKVKYEKPRSSSANNSNSNSSSRGSSASRRYSYGKPYSYGNRNVYSNKNESPIKGFSVQTEPDQADKSSMPIEYGQSHSDDQNLDDEELDAKTDEFALGGVQTKTLYDQFNIKWKTNRKATNTVKYGETIDNVSNEVAVDTDDSNQNSATIKDLKPATKYFFSIQAIEEGRGDAPKTYEGTFTTRGYPVKVLVRNKDKAIQDATVTLEKNSGVKSQTDSDGAAFFELKDGKYTIVISYNDEDYKKEIEVEKVDFPQGKEPSTQQFEVDLSSYSGSKGGLNIGVILAIVFGIIFLIILIAVGIVLYLRKKKQEEQYSYGNDLIDFNQVDINQPTTMNGATNSYQQPPTTYNPNAPAPPPPPVKTNNDVPENEYFSDL